jgi:hypothetical protein
VDEARAGLSLISGAPTLVPRDPCNEAARRAAVALGSNVRHAKAIDDPSSRNGGQEVSTDPKVYPGGGTGRAKTPQTPACLEGCVLSRQMMGPI